MSTAALAAILAAHAANRRRKTQEPPDPPWMELVALIGAFVVVVGILFCALVFD